MRAFITGAGGQDASYLVEDLLAEGVEVHGLALAGEGRPVAWPGAATLHVGDLTDVSATRRLLHSISPDVVYNLAAMSSVAQAWADPEACMKVNGHAAVALMESALTLQERSGRSVRFVRPPARRCIGEPAAEPQDESTPLRPVNPYGRAKAFAHEKLPEFRAKGLHASGMIMFNHESPRRPPTFVSRKITLGVAAIAGGRAESLTLGKSRCSARLGVGTDAVDALRRAAAAEDPGDYVVATGVAHSVREFVALAFRHAGIEDWESLVRTDPALTRPADAVALVGSPERARRRLGWRPRSRSRRSWLACSATTSMVRGPPPLDELARVIPLMRAGQVPASAGACAGSDAGRMSPCPRPNTARPRGSWPISSC